MAGLNRQRNGDAGHGLGHVLWSLSDENSATKAVVEQAARAFGMSVQFCLQSEVTLQARLRSAAVIGVEFTADTQGSLECVHLLHTQHSDTVLLAVPADANLDTLRAALTAGASDVLSLPLAPAELNKALLRAHQIQAERASSGVVDGEVVVIYGARGGLGATTLAVNLAVRLATITRQKSAIVDLDLQRGDVATFMNLAPTQSLASFNTTAGDADDVFLQGVLGRHPSNVHVLSAPSDIEEAELIGRDQVKKALDIIRRRFQYVLVDTPRIFTEVSIAAFEVASRIMVIADLTIPGVRAAQRTMDLLGRLDISLDKVDLLVIEPVGKDLKAEEAARVIGRPPLMTIPRDLVAATEAMNAGTPLDVGRGSPLISAISNLAAQLTGTSGAEQQSSPLLRRIFGLGRSATS